MNYKIVDKEVDLTIYDSSKASNSTVPKSTANSGSKGDPGDNFKN